MIRMYVNRLIKILKLKYICLYIISYTDMTRPDEREGQNPQDPATLKKIVYNIWGAGSCQCLGPGPHHGPQRPWNFSKKISAFGQAIFKSYLCNRSQYIQLHEFKSVNYIATSDVPQGSNLGPLFFNMFINNIVNVININYLLYADDVKIYASINGLVNCERL